MVDQTKVSAAVNELKELKELFEKIKTDSEEFFARSRALSETGAHEAHDLIEAVRSNWDSVLKNFSVGGLSTLFTSAFGGKKSASKKKVAPAKKTAKKAQTSKKVSGGKAKKKAKKK